MLRKVHAARKAVMKRFTRGVQDFCRKKNTSASTDTPILNLPGSPKREPFVFNPVNIICCPSAGMEIQGRKALMITRMRAAMPMMVVLDIVVD